MTVLNQFGQPVSHNPNDANYVPTDPAGPGGSSWEAEEIMDVEWAHAVAPGARIAVIECTDDWAHRYTGVVTAAAGALVPKNVKVQVPD